MVQKLQHIRYFTVKQMRTLNSKNSGEFLLETLKSNRLSNQCWPDVLRIRNSNVNQAICFERFPTFCLNTYRQAGNCRDHSCWVTCQTAGYSGCMRLDPSSGPPMSPCSLTFRVTFTSYLRNSYATQCMTLGKCDSPQIAAEPSHNRTHMDTDWRRGRNCIWLVAEVAKIQLQNTHAV